MKQARLNRLFNPRTSRCFDVALDHGFFNEASFLAGIENLPQAVKVLVEAGQDAIQLTIGQADVANVYGRQLPRSLFSRMIADPVVQALRVDAACVVVNLFRIPEQPEVTDQCIQNILILKPACDHFGMPLMIEPLVFQPNALDGGYSVDGDPEKIIPLVRQAVELGADVIKADPTNDVADYRRVIETAGGVPVLVRGGSRASEDEVLARTEGLLAQGAAGIVYGRNIIQHPQPARMTRALMGVVHEGLSAVEAGRRYLQ
jgi:fructose-bisphosphate aldolase, class I